jgi:serine/threonine protein kinase
MPQSDGAYCFNPTCQAPQNGKGRITCQNCGATLLLKGRYRCVKPLGQRSTTCTFLGLDLQEPEGGHCIIQQFCDRRCANALPLVSHLDVLSRHPQLPSLQDCFDQEGSFYWVQSYISGQTLAARLKQYGKFKADEVWHVLETLLPLLNFIHRHRVIHGDIKPANIIAGHKGASDTELESNLAPKKAQSFNTLTLVDFSTAKLADNAVFSALDSTLGNAEFTAPEQIRGQPTFASDLYSLGVTCLHLLTEMHPFDLIDAANNCWAWQIFGLPENLSESEDSSHLAEILDRLIAPNLDQRFSSAEAAIAHLQTLRGKAIPIPEIPPLWTCYATLTGRGGLSAAVNAVAIAPNDQWVASGSNDTTVQIWDMQTGLAKFTLKGHNLAVLCLAFAPNTDTRLATGSRDRTIKLWDLQTHQVTHTLIDHQHRINTLAYSPNGECLASGSADKTINLWNPTTGALIATLSGPRLGITAIAFSPTVAILAGASVDASVQVWDTNTLERIYTLTEHTAAVRAIAFSPDGHCLATGSEDRTIRIWDTATWQCHSILSGHPWPISALTFSPDGKNLISGSWDKTIKVWQAQTGKVIETLIGHHDTVSGIAISSSGKLIASSSLDKTLRLWRC